MYPDVILGFRNLSGTSQNNLKETEPRYFLHNWLKDGDISLHALWVYSKMLWRLLDRWKLFGNILTRHTSKDFSQVKKQNKKTTSALTSKIHNMLCESESLIVYVCLVIWCFILCRILEYFGPINQLSALFFGVMYSHIFPRQGCEVKKRSSCFSIFEHNSTSKAGHTQFLGWVYFIDFCSLKMVFSFMVKSGTFCLEKPVSVVIRLSYHTFSSPFSA